MSGDRSSKPVPEARSNKMETTRTLTLSSPPLDVELDETQDSYSLLVSTRDGNHRIALGAGRVSEEDLRVVYDRGTMLLTIHIPQPPPPTQPKKLQGPCAVCGVPSELRCSRCKCEFYCNKSHQQQAWFAGHNKACGAGARLAAFLERKLLESVESVECRVVPGKGKALFARRSFQPGDSVYTEVVLSAGCEDPRNSRACCHCFSCISSGVKCCSCEAMYCSSSCMEAGVEEHKHLCEGHVFQGSEDLTGARSAMLHQVRTIGSDCECTTKVIANVIWRAEVASSTVMSAWQEHFGWLDSGGVGWSSMIPSEVQSRQMMLSAYRSVLLDCFGPQIRSPKLQLKEFLCETNLDQVMAQIALNITLGNVESTDSSESVSIWALAAVHACTNHCCYPQESTRCGTAPNVEQHFEPCDALGLKHRCVAIGPIEHGEELTLCYATESTAREAGYSELRQFLKERRLFDCVCVNCTRQL